MKNEKRKTKTSEMDIRYALGVTILAVFLTAELLIMLCPGTVTYWLWADAIVIPCAIWSLARLWFAGRQGRFSWAAMLCLLLCLGTMVYNGYRVVCIQPSQTVSMEFWLFIDAVSLPLSAATAALADRTGNDGRLRRRGVTGQ